MSEPVNDSDAAWERELRAALAALPGEQAPRSLRRRLQGIPRRARRRHGWLRPAWALALVVPVVVVIGLQQQRLARQEAELLRARQDLALALSYLEKANNITTGQISAALDTGLARPVAEQTRYGLTIPVETTLETRL